jgi:DNA repair protein RadD
MLTLRTYQSAALDALYAWFREHPEGNPLLVQPTGSGKSILIAALIKEALTQWPGQRILMLTHVKELIAQNAAKLKTLWPDAPMGIHSAGLRQHDLYEPIIFAGIQSVWKKAMHLGRFDLIIVDESHLISNGGQGMYRTFLDAATEINPAIRVIGLTATPFRTGSGSIMHGDQALFHGVAHQVQVLDLIEQGYLSPLISKRMATRIDLSEVHTRQGEFVARELEAAVDRESITQAALDEIMGYGDDRRAWLVFCTGVDHARHVAQALEERGIPTGCVTGKTPAAERDKLITQYRAGQLRALTNANVLTTGFDAPQTDMLIMLRPTQSPGLYVQMMGRGMRIAERKDDCLVMDFAKNVLRHGPVDKVEAWIPRPKAKTDVPGDAPAKECPECHVIVAAAATHCSCGYVFPPPEPDLQAQASNAPILSTQYLPTTYDIDNIGFRVHRKKGKPDSLRVDYLAGTWPFQRTIATEWVCLAHSGYAKAKAIRWWMKFMPDHKSVSNINDAVSLCHAHARCPKQISVSEQGKYPEVKHYEFGDDSNACAKAANDSKTGGIDSGHKIPS